MADTKISGLPAVVTPAGGDEFVVNQGGVSKKETLAQIASYIASNGYGDENAQDAVGAILSDAGDIDFTYDDVTPFISAVVKPGLDAVKIADGSVTNVEFQYLANVTSDIQAQLTTLAGAGVSDGDKGNITVSGGGTTWTIDNDVITYAKMQDVSAASRLIGRGDSGVGDPQEITLGTGLVMTGTTLSVSGSGYTDEEAQDAIGTILTDSAEIDFTYNDATPSITASIITASIDESKLDASVNASLDLADSAIQATTAATLSSKKIAYTSALSADDTYEGQHLVGLNAGATIAQWETVYLDGSSTWQLADADGTGTYPARGLAVAAYTAGNAATIFTYGTVRNDAWTWTPGDTIYLSTTAGGLTQTAPSVSGDKVQAVGYALTADVAFFDFNSMYLTIT